MIYIIEIGDMNSKLLRHFEDMRSRATSLSKIDNKNQSSKNMNKLIIERERCLKLSVALMKCFRRN